MIEMLASCRDRALRTLGSPLAAKLWCGGENGRSDDFKSGESRMSSRRGFAGSQPESRA